MANLITGLRIPLSVALLFCPAFSPSFFAVYLAAGLSDMIDGAVARKTNTASAFGSRLDTAADFVFVAVCLIKLLPAMHIPIWLYVWTGIIAAIKTINLISGFICRKKFVAIHMAMNKAAGVLLFILPLALCFAELKYPAILVCTAATFAAVQEGHLIRTGQVD
ncbi:MAG: CDP-alcohol phosphatidyltransferase family protein [Firmicutes bacterium]|nr:CDP-alcohol phosphatidyltransferase family protein [Bacillota bacterium]